MTGKTTLAFVLAIGGGVLLGSTLNGRPAPADAARVRSAGMDETRTAFLRHHVEQAKGPNVLLISIDTLRADHMSLHGYSRNTTPAIDAFARSARVFENAYTTSSFTSPAVASMITGLYPPHHRIRLLWQRIEETTITIADHLRRAGYRTAAVVSNIVISDRAWGLGNRFDHFDDTVDDPPANRPYLLERRAAPTTDAAIAWMKDATQSDGPTFLWVHYMDPHGPYDPPADAPADFRHDTPVPLDPASVSPSARIEGVRDAAEYVDRYDEEIAYVDREIGRLLATYESMGFAENALIILTADHGEYLTEHKTCNFTHALDVGKGVLHIPMIVRGPGISARRIAAPVSLADVTPTILEAAGLPLPEALDGRSLLGDIAPRPPYAEGPDSSGTGGLRRTFIYADRKIIVQHGRSNEPRRAWAFDTAIDPDEHNPLPVDPAEPAYLVLAQMIRSDPDPGGQPQHYTKGDEPVPLVASGVDEHALEQLRSLGYVE